MYLPHSSVVSVTHDISKDITDTRILTEFKHHLYLCFPKYDLENGIKYLLGVEERTY